MKTITQVGEARVGAKSESTFAIDTTFVLFFLAIEFGRSFVGFSIDGILLTTTLMVVMLMPYFLSNERGDFKSWAAGRAVITLLAIFFGWTFKQLLGTALPEMFRFLPMTLLIVTAMLSCYIQFYSFLKLRLVK